MIVIADTTPIITLLKLERLELLEKIFGQVIIPNAVYEELTANQKYLSEAKVIGDCSFLKRGEVSDRQAIKILREVVGLDAGESEAIALADEQGADLLIIDERKGRRAAKQMGLKIAGTIGILIQSSTAIFFRGKKFFHAWKFCGAATSESATLERSIFSRRASSS